MHITRSRWIAITLIAGAGLGASSAAFAHVDIGVDIGVPGVVYAPPPPPVVYAPPPPVVYAPAPAPGVVVVSPGWYGERYYDGRRYWDRDAWEERHPGWDHDRDHWHHEHEGEWHHHHDHDD